MTSRTIFMLLCVALLAATPSARSQATAAQAPTTPPNPTAAPPNAAATPAKPATPEPPAANTKFMSARALYYTPTAQGLKSFKCNVDFDWKDFLSRYANGAEIKDDNPFLQYLRTVRLTTTDDLNGEGTLEWTTTSAPPAGKENSADQMKHGMEQMMVGFFSSWNAYMNGNMVPIPDSTTTITETADGFHMHAAAPTIDVTELFDKNLLLTEAHVVQPTNDVYAYPTYTDTPDGRIVSTVRTVFRQPPTAPPAELTINITYTPVEGFRLPSTLAYELKNVGSFAFKFSACSVQSAKKTPEATD